MNSDIYTAIEDYLREKRALASAFAHLRLHQSDWLSSNEIVNRETPGALEVRADGIPVKHPGKILSKQSNIVGALKHRLMDFAKSPLGLSFSHVVALDERPSRPTEYQLRTDLRPEDERFWGQHFAIVARNRRAFQQHIRIVYNAMLCFRDYSDNVLVRHTDFNAQPNYAESGRTGLDSVINRFLESVGIDGENVTPKFNRDNFVRSTQYLLAGEISARDEIHKWFSSNCPEIIVHDSTPSHDLRKPDIRGSHLVLLGNPRTNWMIDMVQQRNPDFRYIMRTDKMRLLIRNVRPQEIEILALRENLRNSPV